MENAKNDAPGAPSANGGLDTSSLSRLTAPPAPQVAHQGSCQSWSWQIVTHIMLKSLGSMQ